MCEQLLNILGKLFFSSLSRARGIISESRLGSCDDCEERMATLDGGPNVCFIYRPRDPERGLHNFAYSFHVISVPSSLITSARKAKMISGLVSLSLSLSLSPLTLPNPIRAGKRPPKFERRRDAL